MRSLLQELLKSLTEKRKQEKDEIHQVGYCYPRSQASLPNKHSKSRPFPSLIQQDNESGLLLLQPLFSLVWAKSTRRILKLVLVD